MKKLLSLLLLLPAIVWAQPKLPNIISDGMVLQQNSKVRLWGESEPNSTVEVTTQWNEESFKVKSSQTGRWQVQVPTTKAGGPYSITFTTNGKSVTVDDILLGEVWICAGQSNMSMPVRGFESQPVDGSLQEIVASQRYPTVRMFTAQRTTAKAPATNVKGRWDRASINTTGLMSAVGYFFAKELAEVLQVPVAIINISWGGSNAQAWMSGELLGTIEGIDVTNIDFNSKSPQRIPTALHNGMFAPLAPYTVRGITWYQGESNIIDYKLYEKLFPAMVKQWREMIGQGDIPFYYVQIAPHNYSGSNKTESAMLREVQARCQHLIPNSAMVATGDLGNGQLIHPSAKQPVGQRLSYAALARDYGFSTLPYAAPSIRTKQTDGNRIIVSFDNTKGGLILIQTTANLPDSGFEIAGTDGKYYQAQARVNPKKSDSVELWSESVARPVDVRYCFKNFSTATLYNCFGLPALPFRTDFQEE